MKVNAAAPGCAHPLAQPDTCMVNEPSRNGLAACAITGASWRVESMADRQAGARAPAAPYRRPAGGRRANPPAAPETMDSVHAPAAHPAGDTGRPAARPHDGGP